MVNGEKMLTHEPRPSSDDLFKVYMGILGGESYVIHSTVTVKPSCLLGSTNVKLHYKLSSVTVRLAHQMIYLMPINKNNSALLIST